jgi:hypothetical protein
MEAGMEKGRKSLSRIAAAKLKLALRPAFVSACYLFVLLVLRSVASGQAHLLIEPWHLPVGFAIGVLLAFGFQYGPLIFAGQFIVGFWPGSSGGFVYTLLDAGFSTATYMLAALAVRVTDRRSQVGSAEGQPSAHLPHDVARHLGCCVDRNRHARYGWTD